MKLNSETFSAIEDILSTVYPDVEITYVLTIYEGIRVGFSSGENMGMFMTFVLDADGDVIPKGHEA